LTAAEPEAGGRMAGTGHGSGEAGREAHGAGWQGGWGRSPRRGSRRPGAGWPGPATVPARPGAKRTGPGGRAGGAEVPERGAVAAVLARILGLVWADAALRDGEEDRMQDTAT
jgi:hypothetical protein